MATAKPTAMTARMPSFTFPLGGDVSQVFRFWADAFDNAQIGLINIDLGETPDPDLERRIVEKVGSYGRQLGRISEAMEVLLDRCTAEGLLDPGKLDADQAQTLEDFRAMLAEVKALKDA